MRPHIFSHTFGEIARYDLARPAATSRPICDVQVRVDFTQKGTKLTQIRAQASAQPRRRSSGRCWQPRRPP